MFELRLTKTAKEDSQKIALKTQTNILERIKILETTPFPTILALSLSTIIIPPPKPLVVTIHLLMAFNPTSSSPLS